MSYKYERDLFDELKKYEKNMDPNILLCGNTGCGKSSLINAIFDKKIAEVSDSESITRKTKIYSGEEYGLPLNLIDTRGYEIQDNAEEYFQGLLTDIKKLQEEGIIINPVWYCISLAKKRIEEVDITLLKKLVNENLNASKVCIVITKCDEDDDKKSIFKKLEAEIRREPVLKNIPIFESSKEEELEVERTKLIEWSMKQIDNDMLIDAFKKNEKAKLRAKKEKVESSIAKYTASAAVVGASPIPFSDSAVLIPIQVTMISSIISTYGLKSLVSISKAIIADIIVGNIGKAAAGSLLKLIPGVGTIIGGAINAGVASAITYGLGKTTSEICYDACLDMLEGKEVEFENLFQDKENLTKKTKEFSKQYKK